MSETPKRRVVLAMDGSEYADYAFNCKFAFLRVKTVRKQLERHRPQDIGYVYNDVYPFKKHVYILKFVYQM